MRSLAPCSLALLALASLLVAVPVRAQEMTDRAIERCTRAAVRIQVDVPGGSSSGSGSIIDADGYVLTNFHVIGHTRHGEHGGPGTLYDAEHVQIATVTSARDTATTRYIGRVVRGDVRLDLALVRIVSNADGSPLAADATFPTIPMTTTAALRPGVSLWAFGFPLGLRTINATGGHMTGFQMGSSSGGEAAVSWIRTDAEFNPGNSGGMLVDRQGRLVAVPTAVVSSGETLEPIELARPVERMPAEWRTALEHGPIDDVVVTGISDLTTGTELADRAMGDSGGLGDAPEVFYYHVPSDRPGMITVTPSVPLGLIGPSGDVGREGRGTIQVFPHDPQSLTLAVLVERSADGTPVDFRLRFEQTTATPPSPYPPGYGGRPPPYPPGYGPPSRGRVPYGYPQPPPTTTSVGAPVSVHGRVVDVRTGAPLASATVMIARPGADLASMLGLLAAGRMTQAQIDAQLIASVQTDAEGYYTLTDVPRGRFQGSAVMTGYATAMITVTIGPTDPAVIEALPIQLSH